MTTNIRHILSINTPTEEREIVLKAAVYSMGRDASNAIHINAQSISRQHALLIRVPNPDDSFHYQIRDGDAEGHRSTNGFKVNGHRYDTYDLNHGDVITIGHDVKLSYRMEDASLPQEVTTLSYRSVKIPATNPEGTLLQADTRLKLKLSKLTAPLEPTPTPEEQPQYPRSRRIATIVSLALISVLILIGVVVVLRKSLLEP